MATLVASQRDLQAKPDAEIAALLGGKPFTTVGFEHEFGQLNDEGSVLHNLTHLELAKSENFGYSGLPFSLETDASDAIELVSPPFIMETNEQGVPATKDVVDADRLMKTGLSGLLTAPVKFSGLKTKFGSDAGISFAGEDAKVKSFHVKPGISDRLMDRIKPPASSSIVPAAGTAVPETEAGVPRLPGSVAPPRRTELDIPAADINDLEIKISKKSGGVTSQANIAVDAAAYFQAKKAVKSRLKPENAVVSYFTQIKTKIAEFIGTSAGVISFSEPESNLLDEISTNLSQRFIVVPMAKVMEEKEKIFQGEELDENERKQYASLNRLASFVKDISGVWFKDTIFSLCEGILQTQVQKQKFATLFTAMKGRTASLHTRLKTVVDEEIWVNVFIPGAVPEELKYENAMKDKIDASIDALLTYFTSATLDIDDYARPEFMGDNPALLGGRQDTFIPQSKIKKAPAFRDKRMYVVEVRNHDLEASLHAMETGEWKDTPKKKTTKKKAKKPRPASSAGAAKTTASSPVKKAKAKRVTTKKKLKGKKKKPVAGLPMESQVKGAKEHVKRIKDARSI